MLEPGRVLGRRYEIIQEIGSGGMANVYKARDNKLNRLVAIKVLKQEMALDDTIHEKFRKEALAAGSLNHPNIVSVYDMGHELGSDYIVMELIEGITLKEYIKRRDTMSCEEVLKISIKIADALKAAHQNGIIHRDIKPQNIMVTPQGDVKVTDFGIAKAATSGTSTATGETLGSVHYLSPEQARGAEVDARSDLYSLGITMYEMATKELPFVADTPVAVAMMQLHDPFPNPMTKAPHLWDGLCDIIIKLTQKKPELRYQSADALMIDMKRLYRNHNYRISAGVPSIMIDKTDPNAAKLAAIERQRHEARKEQLMREREERAREKKKKRNWIIAVSCLSVLLVILLAILITALLRSVNHRNDNTSSSVPTETSSIPEETQSTPEESGETSVLKTVGSYVGMKYEEAQTKVRADGFYLNVEAVSDDSADVGTVVRQSPAEGETVGDNMTVTLYVSSGPEAVLVKVPDITNRSEADAQKLLDEAGLETGQITTEYSDTVPEGYVVSQKTEAGTEVEEGSSIDFTISLGAEESKAETKAGTYTIANPFTDGSGSGHLKVYAVDGDANKTAIYDNSVSYSIFYSLGGSIKVNYPAGTVLIEVYLDDNLVTTEQIR